MSAQRESIQHVPDDEIEYEGLSSDAGMTVRTISLPGIVFFLFVHRSTC